MTRPSLLPSLLPALILAAFLVPDPVQGQDVRSFSLTADNDGFVFWVPPGRRDDRYYTHGLRAEVVAAWAGLGSGLLSDEPMALCGPDSGSAPCLLTRVRVGQAIYTPAYLFHERPVSDDRPYAGWLYFEGTTARVSPDELRALGLEVGVTGKASLAGPVHRWFHRSLGKHEPMGWEYQVPFEPAFALRYHNRKAYAVASGAGRGVLAVEPRTTVAVGTLRTGVTGGLSVLGSWNAPASLDWLGPTDPTALYVQARIGVEGEFVLRDLFLDGRSFGSSPSVDHVPWVGRLVGRAQLGWHNVGLEFAATLSTLEFQGQDKPHSHGTIALIFRS